MKNLLEKLFSDVGKKIKKYVKVLFVLECIASIICGILMIGDASDWDTLEFIGGVMVILFGWAALLVPSWMTYGFGEIIDKLSEISVNTSGGVQVQANGTAAVPAATKPAAPAAATSAKVPSAPPIVGKVSEKAERIGKLKKMFAEGKITQDEFDAAVARIEKE